MSEGRNWDNPRWRAYPGASGFGCSGRSWGAVGYPANEQVWTVCRLAGFPRRERDSCLCWRRMYKLGPASRAPRKIDILSLAKPGKQPFIGREIGQIWYFSRCPQEPTFTPPFRRVGSRHTNIPYDSNSGYARFPKYRLHGRLPFIALILGTLPSLDGLTLWPLLAAALGASTL